MRKIFLTLCMSFILISGSFILEDTRSITYGEKTTPPYAKWGRLAMEETKEKYPDAQIIDYLHRGRQKKGEAMIEQFKLWLRGENREFGVFVSIEFDSKTEEVLHITFLETDR